MVPSLTLPYSRCLLLGHWRVNCRWPVRCRACRVSGPIAAQCINLAKLKSGQDPSMIKGKMPVLNKTAWFSLGANAQPSASSPPIFNSFGELARASWAAMESALEFTVQGRQRPNEGKRDSTPNCPNLFKSLNPALWQLHGSSSSCAATVLSETPLPQQPTVPSSPHLSSGEVHLSSEGEAMAY